MSLLSSKYERQSQEINFEHQPSGITVADLDAGQFLEDTDSTIAIDTQAIAVFLKDQGTEPENTDTSSPYA